MDDEGKIERRVDLAIVLERIDGRLGNIEKRQDDCKQYRHSINKRIEQVDVQLSIVKTKQSGIIKGIYVIAVGLIGVFAKIVHKAISGQ